MSSDLPSRKTISLLSPAQSLSQSIRSSLHSPPASTQCTSLTFAPAFSSRLTAIAMSAIGESLMRIFPQHSVIRPISPIMSGLHSSMRKTLLPVSERLAGSMKMMSGENAFSSSQMGESSQAVWLMTWTLSLPRSLKFFSAAAVRAGDISL